MSIAYGFFSPLEGLWVPRRWIQSPRICTFKAATSGAFHVFDISEQEIKEKRINTGDTILLTYQGQPFAVLELDEIFSYDKTLMAEKVYGTKEEKHPGVKRTYACKGKFLEAKSP